MIMQLKTISAVLVSALISIAAIAQSQNTPEAELAGLVKAGVGPSNFCTDLERWEQTLPRSEAHENLFADMKAYQAICSLPATNLTEVDAQAALGDAPLAADLTDNILTLFARSEKRDPLLCCSVSNAAWTKLGQSGLWAARLRLAEADKALLKLAIFDHEASDLSEPILIRGENAPAEALFMANPEDDTKGQVIEAALASPQLGEMRKLTIYLPPNHQGDGSTAVLIMADGQSAGYYARMVEPMIAAGLIKPLAIIGIHSGNRSIVDPDQALADYDVRALDYLPSFVQQHAPDLLSTHPNRFENHMSFVVDTLLPWAREKYGLSADRLNTGVTGQSNGAVFALNAGFLHPETFGTSIPISPGWRGHTMQDAPKLVGEAATFFIAAGLYEPGFLASAQASASGLRAAGYDVKTTWNAAGHSPDQTKAMLFKYLPQAFPTSLSSK